MTEIIKLGEKALVEIPIQKLNGVLVLGEMAIKRNRYTLPVVLLNKKNGECRGLETTVNLSGGVQSGTFFVDDDRDGIFYHEEYTSEDDFPYRVFVDANFEYPEIVREFLAN